MKPSSFIVITCLFVTTTFAQIPRDAIAIESSRFNNYFLNKKNIPKVKGKIIHLTKKDISKIRIEYTIVTPFQQLQIQKTCSLKPDGSFEFKLENAFPYQQIWVNIDNLFYTGVYVNTELFIQLDAKLLKTQTDPSFIAPGAKYLGADGLLNEYTNKHTLYRYDEQQAIISQLEKLRASIKDNDSFLKKNDSLYAALAKIDDEFIRLNPSKFAWILKNEMQANYFRHICVAYWYEDMDAELFDKVKSFTPYLTSNDGMLFYRHFYTYLNGITLRKRAVLKLPYDLANVSTQNIQMLDSLFPSPKSDFLKFQIASNDPKEHLRLMAGTQKQMKTPWCKRAITNEYNKTSEKLASIERVLSKSKPIISGMPFAKPIGELPFGAKLYQVGGIPADSLLAKIKSSFAGKALLIDFWATWCAPCLSELPYSQKLSDSCKDSPIEFIYLCTSGGSSMEKWKSKIVDLKIKGTHIFVDKKLEAALMDLFSFSGYPSYMAINKNGEYIPGMVGRPSEITREKLLELTR